jgi:hypothetical protein
MEVLYLTKQGAKHILLYTVGEPGPWQYTLVFSVP